MAKHTVGCVPYLNARPLARLFADTHEVEVIYDVPSKLPTLLDSGRAEAVLASAYDALQTPGRTYAEGVSIASNGPVVSVRLFSKVPFGQIDSLALDASSLTSNALGRALLAENYAISPRCEPAAPDINQMLEAHDAAILIGDKGMAAPGEGLHVMDLGEAWTELTGLPFVWAIWIGDENLSPELVTLLNRAAHWGLGQSDMLAREAHEETGLPYEACVHYLTTVMDYRLTEAHLRGLKTFRDLLLKHSLLAESLFPTPVAMSKDAAFAP